MNIHRFLSLLSIADFSFPPSEIHFLRLLVLQNEGTQQKSRRAQFAILR